MEIEVRRMIEIVFGDSALGSLKMAQNYGQGDFIDCYSSFGVIGTHDDGSQATDEEVEEARQAFLKEELVLWEKGIPMGGNSEDVYGFSLALSIGDISEVEPGIQRRKVLEWLFSIYPFEDEEYQKQLEEELPNRINDMLKTFADRMKNGESMRIWYSMQPDELCGMYWFIFQLDRMKIDCDRISLVRLSEWESNDENGEQKCSWGEVAAGEWHRYLHLERPASKSFCQNCVKRWQDLRKENAPLRAVLNGQLVSVPDTLYDDFIIREIKAEEKEFQETMIVGRVLGNYRLGIGDTWIAHRIEKMIQAGMLEAVNEAPEDMPIYHRTLRKCGME